MFSSKASTPSSGSTPLPPYDLSSTSHKSPTDPELKRESVWSIIATYSTPSTTIPLRSPILPFSSSPRNTNEDKGSSVAPPLATFSLSTSPRPFPRDSFITLPSPKDKKQGPPTSPWDQKWEWIVPQGNGMGEEEGHVVDDKGRKEDVFGRIEEMEKRANELAMIKLKEKRNSSWSRWEPETDRQVSFTTILTYVQTLFIFICIGLLLLVLLSPVATFPNASLFVLHFDDNRTVTLGPIGACWSSPTSQRTCTLTSLTPTFNRVYSTSSLPSSQTTNLPFSFPIFPTILILTIILLTLSFAQLAYLAFPRRHHTWRFTTLSDEIYRLKIVRSTAATTLLAFILGLVSTIIQFAELVQAVDDFVAESPVKSVEVGKGVSVLWGVWALVGVTVLSWGVVGVGQPEGEGKKREDGMEMV